MARLTWGRPGALNRPPAGRETMRSMIVGIAMGLVGRAAFAEPAAEAKAGKKIENREPVNPGSSFKKGDTIYVWSSLSGADGTTVQHVWKRDGKEVRRATFHVPGARWRLNSRYTGAPDGSYVVEVVSDDKKLTE